MTVVRTCKQGQDRLTNMPDYSMTFSVCADTKVQVVFLLYIWKIKAVVHLLIFKQSLMP